MVFEVTKISEGVVKPAEPTPNKTLRLAWVDRYPTHRGLVESIHIYRAATDPAKVIREALAKALVFFYPLAGHIIEPVPGEPSIECSAKGVYFVEANANCSLEDVKYLHRPLLIPKEELVPCPGPDDWAVEPHNTSIMMQVTTFTCGGFVLGLRTNHAVADGMGAAQFIQAVGDMARGLPEPLVLPVWDRQNFPDPKIKPSPIPELPVLALDYVILDFSMDYIKKLKSKYMDFSGKICSTFDILTAKLWQCRTRALDLKHESEVNLGFFASVRHLLKLNKGYYGNSIFPVKVTASSKKILNSDLVEVVNLIREAKERMAEEFFKFAREEIDTDPFQMTFNYESVYVSDWSKLGFVDADYGFGKPMLCSPLVNNDFIASVVILKAPAPLEGARLLASCVTKEHSMEFIKGMNNME
ncbi:HXXXD-type acyl-transferase family protein [Rhynchospora pubera]|uniref:HXXXD-type acyl-transferase family protein n=1 Tax=Rhynchospora pubera TaxID=906938 RepID=A0AAV8FES6_9POAL|nr:HXXXD-type acyl-transferase family protein [Rhynchospora pubera]